MTHPIGLWRGSAVSKYNEETMHTLLNEAKAVLFDLDGTLAETEIDFDRMRQVVRQTAAKYGCPDHVGHLEDILAGVHEVRDYLLERDQGAADQFIDEVMKRLRDLERLYCEHPVEVDGALNLLQELRQAGKQIGIITRNDREVALRTLAILSLPFDVLVARDDVSKPKPDPGHVLAALKALNASPASSVVVGDLWIDIDAGQRAGCRTIGIWRRDRMTNPFEAVTPDLTVRAISELLQ